MIENTRKMDPTGTLTLRNAYSAKIVSGFRTLKNKIKEYFQNDSVFNAEFSFRSDPQKVKNFRNWLKTQIANNVLKITNAYGNDITDPDQIESVLLGETRGFVRQAYVKGARDAYRRSRKAGFVQDEPFLPWDRDETFHLNSLLQSPLSINRLELLYTRAWQSIANVTDTMAKQMTDVFTDSVTRGLGPNETARMLNERVDNVGISRARTIARTELIRANAEGSLDDFEFLGIPGVEVMAEWSTAGDGKVCSLCKPLNHIVMPIQQARGMIPRHPNCFISPFVKVVTSNGTKQIYRIQVGDYVLTHKNRFKKVTNVLINRNVRTKVTHVRTQNNVSVMATPEHPFLAYDNEWIAAEDLCETDNVQVYLDGRFFIDEVVYAKTESLERVVHTYNLTVQEDESFIADGYVVHNCRCGWMPANIEETDGQKQIRKPSTVRERIKQSMSRRGADALSWPAGR